MTSPNVHKLAASASQALVDSEHLVVQGIDWPWWSKALLAAGGIAATAALVYYLLQETDEEEQKSVSAAAVGSSPKEQKSDAVYYKVTDPKKRCIGVRQEPSTAR